MGKNPGKWRRRRSLLGACAVVSAAVLAAVTVSTANADAPPSAAQHGDQFATTTPIKHVVVIFGENISFDHYFGTYPKAANTDGTPFTAAQHTPKVNGLTPRTRPATGT